MMHVNEMCIPSASFSGTADKDNVDEESNNEVLLIKERNSLSGSCTTKSKKAKRQKLKALCPSGSFRSPIRRRSFSE